MKFLFCSEFFYPSVGGAQEVVKQISVELARRGYDVTVATSMLDSRTETEIDGVKIVEFLISGNLVRGLSGEVDRYRNFVCTGDFDAIFIYAAQQWALDALLDDLAIIKARKVLVPCGFSGFYQAEYQYYFQRLAIDLKHFDSLVFHTRSYRDYKFLSALYKKKCIFIPNGAADEEFMVIPEPKGFRHRQDIASDSFAILTIGALNGAKGHLELAKAVANLQTKRHVHVILNGNSMPHSPKIKGIRIVDIIRVLSPHYIYQQVRKLIWQGLNKLGLRKTYIQELQDLVASINAGEYGENKRASIVDLTRTELVQCLFGSDLFVFASRIEYSPLVLFEAAAAGLPFITTPVGNAREIVDWTGAGHICESSTNELGYTFVDPISLAQEIDLLIEQNDKRLKMGRLGREAWKKHFTWHTLIDDYEKILCGSTIESREFEGTKFE